MTIEGVDYSFDRPSSPAALHNAGKQFAARYLAIPPNGKILTRSEADGLAAAGVWSVVVWEQSGHGSVTPEDAAQHTLDQAHTLGIPEGRPIYVAVDFDVQPADFHTVRDWVTRFHKALAGRYDGRALYGSYYLVKAGFDEGWLKWGWQTYAWSNGLRDARAQLYQYHNGVNVAGCDCDLDRAYQADYGQWMPGKLPADADTGETGGDKVVHHYKRVDGKAARSGGHELAPEAGVWLNTDPAAPNSQASNIVGKIGEYTFVIHVRLTGAPGDGVDVLLYWDDTKTSGPHSPHYTERIEIGKTGQALVNVPFANAVGSGDAVYARLVPWSSNQGNITLTRFDTDALLFE